MEFTISMGDVFVTLVGLLITYVLNSINIQMKEIKETVRDLSSSLISLDKRVVRLETKQNISDIKE